MDEKEYKEFLAWFGKATGTTEQAQIEELINSLTDEEQDQVLIEWNNFKNNIKKAKQGMKCPKGLIPNYLKVGGKITQCGCKRPKLNLDKETLATLHKEVLKCGGKIKKVKK